MNLSKAIFKFLIVVTFVFRLMLITLPLSWIIVQTKEGGWKYGFTFIQNNFEVALFVSFAISFLISLYHALSFDVIEGAPEENYLKTVQSVKVAGNVDLETLHKHMSANTNRYKNVEVGDKLTAERKVIFLPPDKITISSSDNLFEVESKPFTNWWFIDFGRNFLNVKEIAQLIKSKNH